MDFLSENIWSSIKIWPKFVPMGPINNKPTLAQVMAWCWTGNKLKPLSEPMEVEFIEPYATWLQWVNI